MIEFRYDDGGRSAAGLRGTAGDCVTRAIAIAAALPYRDVYDGLARVEADRAVRARADRRRHSPRDGVLPAVYKTYLAALGWTWTPTMTIGSGTTVHLRADELPAGRLIVRLSKHLCAVVDGVVHDIYDPSRDGTRAVYGYWRPPILDPVDTRL